MSVRAIHPCNEGGYIILLQEGGDFHTRVRAMETHGVDIHFFTLYNNAHSIAKYGVVGRLDVEKLHCACTVLSVPHKRSQVGHGSKKCPAR